MRTSHLIGCYMLRILVLFLALDLVPDVVESSWLHDLGHDIGEVIVGVHLAHHDDPEMNIFTNHGIAELQVAHRASPMVLAWVVGPRDCATLVHEHICGLR